MRREIRRALVGAAGGAILGAIAAVAYTRLDDTRSSKSGIQRAEAVPVTLQQLMTIGMQVVNVMRQLLSLA